MPGIGDYIKGKKFTLKSGNTPVFKMMGNTEAGDSPITNEFGIGKGTSPYEQDEGDQIVADAEKNVGQSQKDIKAFQKETKGAKWKKAGMIALGALTSGLDAVYGSGKIMPEGSKVKFSKDDDKKKEKKETIAQKEVGSVIKKS